MGSRCMDDAQNALIAASLKVLDITSKVLVPPLLGVAGWAFTSIKDLDARVHYIEQTRYTAADRDKDFNTVTQSLQTVIVNQAVQQSKLEAIEKKLDKGVER